MSHAHLAVYLHDHRAGAVAAIELLEHLERSHHDTPVATFARELRAEVIADVGELERLMARASVGSSTARKAAAWVSEKVAELKTLVDDPADGKLRLLETLDAVALGIDGKRALWLALQAAADSASTLPGVDYARLIQRAEAQRLAVEGQRVSAARAALQNGAA